jgi:hypothetical protein
MAASEVASRGAEVPESIEATVRVRGAAADREAFRRRANEMLASGFPEVVYHERHVHDALDWHLECAGAMPFRPFVEGSVELPALEVRLEWREPDGGRTVRRARLQAGRLVLDPAGTGPGTGEERESVAVRAAPDGALGHAIVMRRSAAGTWAGYVASATRHAFFRFDPEAGELLLSEGLDPEWHWRVARREGRPAREPLAPTEPMSDTLAEILHDLADRFAAEWLWFDAAPEAATALERHRFAQYGFPVQPANLCARKLKAVLKPDDAGLSLAPDDADARAAATSIATLWAASATD